MELLIMDYYTYLLIDPVTRQPFYVGKGTGTRMYWHWRNRNAPSVNINYLIKQKFEELISKNLKPIYEKVILNVDERTALQKECELIRHYGRVDIGTGILFNFTDGGQAGASSWSPQTRERKSQIELAKQKGRPVSQYDLDGNHLQDFTSCKVASESVFGANRSYITQVCKGRRKSSGGFLWSYKGENVKPFSKKYYHATQQFTLAGKLLNTFRSLTQAQELTGVELHKISDCCRGKSKIAGGFIWKYLTYE